MLKSSRHQPILVSATSDTFGLEYTPEVLLPPSSTHFKPPRSIQTVYALSYLGSRQVGESKSVGVLQNVIKQVRKKCKHKISVQLSFAHRTLTISSTSDQYETYADKLIISLPFYTIALCVLEPYNRGSGHFAISSTVDMMHQVHVFQGNTYEQAEEVIQGLSLAFSESSSKTANTKPMLDGAARFGWYEATLQRSSSTSNTGSHPTGTGEQKLTLTQSEQTTHQAVIGIRPKITKQRLSNDGSNPLLNMLNAELVGPADTHLSANPRRQEDKAKNFQYLMESISFVQNNNNQLKMPKYKAFPDLFEQTVKAVTTRDVHKLSELFKAKNFDIHSRDEVGNSIMHYVAVHGDPKLVLLFIQQDADINSRGILGMTPLHRAAAERSRPMIDCLISRNADVNVADSNLRTPIFMLAAGEGTTCNLAEYFVENGAEIMCHDSHQMQPLDIWRELQDFQQELVSNLCTSVMESLPAGYCPSDIIESSRSTASGDSQVIPPQNASRVSLQQSEPPENALLEYLEDPPKFQTEEERLKNLEKFRLSSSQFSFISDNVFSGEARKLSDNIGKMMNIVDKIVQDLETNPNQKHDNQLMDLFDDDSILEKFGLDKNYKNLLVSPQFFVKLKELQENVKRRGKDRRKYGDDITNRILEANQTSQTNQNQLKDSYTPREMYLPDGSKLDPLQRSSSETMINLISAAKEVRHRTGCASEIQLLDTSAQGDAKPGLMRAMRQVTKPLFEFFTNELASTPQHTLHPSKSNNETNSIIKQKKSDTKFTQCLSKSSDSDSMNGNSKSSVPETGSEISELFNALLSKLDPHGDRMGKVTQLPLTNADSLADIYKTKAPRPKAALNSYERRQSTSGQWVRSRSNSKDQSHFEMDPSTGVTKFIYGDNLSSKTELVESKLGVQVETESSIETSQDKKQARKLNLIEIRKIGAHDPTRDSKLMKSRSSMRPVYLNLGISQNRNDSPSNIQRKILTPPTRNKLIYHPLLLPDVSNADPIGSCISKLLKLSANPECIGYLIAYMGLPKFQKNFVAFARAQNVTDNMRINMGALIHNLFEVAYPDSQRKAIEAGLLDLVIQLVNSRWPLPGVAFSVLTSVIEAKWHFDYTSSIASSTINPLLGCLSVSTDNDSGIDSGRKYDYYGKKGNLKSSIVGGSSFDNAYTSSGSALCSESSHSKTTLKQPVQDQHARCHTSQREALHDSNSNKLTLRAEIEKRSNEPLKCLLNPIHDPKTIVLKILANSSHNRMMKQQLSNKRCINLISEFLADPSAHLVLLTLITIANLAMNTSTHKIIREVNLQEKLKYYLHSNSPHLAHEAARTHIYMGEFDVGEVYLFDQELQEKFRSVEYSNNKEGKPYIKGGTLEALVSILTSHPRKLWGGIQLMSPGPRGNTSITEAGFSRNKSKIMKVEPTDEKIFEFFLTTCRSLCEPIILFRLLCHRFRDPLTYSIFDWNQINLPASRLVYETLPVTSKIPKTQKLVLNVVESWLSNFPEDFKKSTAMMDEVKQRILYPLKKVRGPYYTIAQNIKNLLSQIYIKLRFKEPIPLVAKTPHHFYLYYICNKCIVEGLLPVKQEDAIFLAALQLSIEDRDEKNLKKFSTIILDINKLKSILPPEYAKVKNISKRIRHKENEFVSQQLNERDAKHLYIEYTQNIPGFGCTFYEIKEMSFKKKNFSLLSRWLGISSSKIVALDFKTKESLLEFPFASLKSWFPNTSNKTLVLNFNKKHFYMLVNDASLITEISHIIQSSANDLNDIPSTDRSLFYTTAKTGYLQKITETSSHSTSQDDSPINRMAVDNAPTPFRNYSQINREMNAHDSECLSTSIASKSILPLPEESSVASTHSFEDLMEILGSESLSSNFLNFSEKQQQVPPRLHYISSQRKRRPKSNGLAYKDSNDTSPTLIGKLTNKVSKKIIRSSRSTPKATLVKQTSPWVDRGNATLKRDILDWLSHTRTFDPSEQKTCNKEGADLLEGIGFGKSLFCNCSPESELPANLNLDTIKLEDIIEYPREIAKQITLIDFDMLCSITPEDCLNYVSPGKRQEYPINLDENDTRHPPSNSGNLSKLAFRFSQLSSWVVSSILHFEVLSERIRALCQFIQIAIECYDLRNYHSVQAIVIGALKSPEIRYLEQTWEAVPKHYKEFIDEISELFELRNNYSNYRHHIHTTDVPAIPFFLLYTRDLTYIVNANPDYIRRGLINFDKRRLMYGRLEEIQYFQSHKYQLKCISEVRQFLLNVQFIPQDKLLAISRNLETKAPGSQQARISQESKFKRK